MKQLFSLFIIALLLSIPSFAQFQYVSPMAGSKNLPIEHNIIIREGNMLDASSLSKDLFMIRGSKSGTHDFELVLCDDGKTINLNPTSPFGYTEVVAVTISKGLRTTDGRTIDGYTFSFTTHREWTAEEQETMKNARKILLMQEIEKWYQPASSDHASEERGVSGMFTIGINTTPAPGNIFFDSWSGTFVKNKYTGYNNIKNSGDSVYWKKTSSGPNDFQLGKNGLFDVYRGDKGKYTILDSNFIEVKSYAAKNGYWTDNHECHMTANGNAYIIAGESALIDMTVYNPNYSSHATVVANNIQKFDPSNNVIFEWRGFDHIGITEATHEYLAGTYIDYMHTNSIEEDVDGNILISSRHLDQITKINVSTGNIMWRLGGVLNEFTFPNDAAKFSYQHDARRLANGNITLFDDGNFHSPAKSFAKEYQLDEVNKIATLVWSYSHPDVNGVVAYYFAMGSAQRLSNGNTFINWGWRANGTLPSMTEVKPDGTIVWELTHTDNGKNIVSYRGHKYLWDNICARPTYDKMKTKSITATTANLTWVAVANARQKYEVQYKKNADATWTSMKVSPTATSLLVTGLTASTLYDWRMQALCDTLAGNVSKFTSIKSFTTKAAKNLIPEQQELNVTVFPNPVADQLTIVCNENISSIHIYNLIGQQLKVFEFNADDSDVSFQMPATGLSAGNYLIEVVSENQRKLVRFVKE